MVRVRLVYSTFDHLTPPFLKQKNHPKGQVRQNSGFPVPWDDFFVKIVTAYQQG